MKGVGLAADFRRHHEGEYARHVGLVSQRHQVEHQVDVLVERKSRGAGGVGDGDVREIARFHFLNAALDLADAFEVIRQHGLVGRPQNALQILRFFAHHIEQRRILLGQTRALGRVIALAEQTDEEFPRLGLDG